MNNLNVQDRTQNKTPKQLRGQGFIPGVLYGKTVDSTPVMLSRIQLRKAISQKGEVYTITSNGQDMMVRLDEIQSNPVTQDFIHFSLVELPRGQKNEMSLPLNVEGVAPGVKAGGTLSMVHDHIKVKGLPSEMPDTITIDVSNLEINDHIYARDIALPRGIELVSSADEAFIFCRPPQKVEEATEAAAETEEVATDSAE
jgi:large subunit ribosomal protein L25